MQTPFDRPTGRFLLPAVALALVVAGSVAWPLLQPDAGPAPHASTGSSSAVAVADVSTVALETDRPLGGHDAVTALRSTPADPDADAESDATALEDVAQRYGYTPDELVAALERDSTLQVSPDGMLLYADTFDPDDIAGNGHGHDDHAEHEPRKPGDPDEFASSGTSEEIVPTTEIAPLRDTFKLHSRPGSKKTIYLDVDGHLFTAENGWGNHVGKFYRGWDSAGDGSANFSPEERRRVQELWSRVAQNFAAFDVDVTTEEPSLDELMRTSSTDDVYGHRAVISSHADIIYNATNAGSSNRDPGIGNSAPQSGTVGYSYIGVVGDLRREFVSLNSAGAANLQWVVTHEVGHALGLEHTMDRTDYPGAGGFTNFMDYTTSPHQIFDGRDRAVVTESLGAIGPRVSFAADELDWRSAVAQGLDPADLSPDAPLALPLPDGGRVQSTLSGHGNGANPNGDTDTYRLEGCTHLVANATVSHPHNRSLDLALDLSTHPSSVPGDEHHLLTRANAGSLGSGSEALLEEELDPDTVHYLTVRAANGTGLDDAPGPILTQYFDGASSGDYTLQVTGCEGTPALAEPRALKGHTTVDGSTTLVWENDPALHTEVAVDGRRTVVLAPGVTSHTVATTPDVAVNFRVRAVDAAASSPSQSRWVSGRTTLDLGEPLHVSVTASGLVEIRLHPDRPATSGRLYIGEGPDSPTRSLYYALSVGGTSFSAFFGSRYFPVGRQDYIVLYGPDGPDAGGYEVPYTVAAAGPPPMPTVPSAPTDATWSFHTGTVTQGRASHTVRWEPPASDGESEIFEYRLYVADQVISLDGSARSHTIHDVPVGSPGAVVAVNAAGESTMAHLGQLSETPLPLAPPAALELREDSLGSHLTWDVPAQVPARSVAGWRVTIGGRTVTLPAGQRTLNLAGMRSDRATRVSLALVGPQERVSENRTVTLAPAAD